MDNSLVEQVFADRYEIIEKLGSGGMAEVYRAIDRELKRHVAIKVLHTRFGRDSQFIERFRREARAAAGLNHPNVVQVYDWGQQDGIYFIVMELFEGQSLKEAIAERGPLTPQESISVTLQVCAALDYAHEHRVIHRDIKPHNIMISRAGHVKVTDFGIAYAQNDGATVTQEGYLVGTAQYCSPEQAQGRPVVRGSDLYSLGIVLYEMLTKRVPFEADNAVSVAVMQVQDEPTPPSEFRPDIPAGLEKVILKALAKHAEDRFLDAQEMSRALERARSEIPASAYSTDAIGPPRNFDEQPTVIARGVTVPSAPARHAAPRAGGAPQKQQGSGRRRIIIIAIAILLLLGLGIALALSMRKPALPPAATTVTTPDLGGLTVTEATRILAEEGLKEGEVHEEPNDEAAEGTIFKQNPSAGSEAEKGDEVDIWVSMGPEGADVPRVTGELIDDATELLQSAGFTVGDVTEVFDESIRKDEVISQSPAAGEKAAKGSVVNLTVSKGAKPVETVVVPSLRGRSLNEALALLKARGLKAAQEDEYSDTVIKNTIIRQTPEAGATVNPGSTITIFVSKGSSQVEVPDLKGLPETAARRELSEAGLKSKTTEEENSLFTAGTVIGQSPLAGTMVAPGTTITLVIAIKPANTSSTTTSTSEAP